MPIRRTHRPADDRRTGGDRRRADKGPQGRRERRVGIEPRRPEVSEVEPTPAEWEALIAAAVPTDKS